MPVAHLNHASDVHRGEKLVGRNLAASHQPARAEGRPRRSPCCSAGSLSRPTTQSPAAAIVQELFLTVKTAELHLTQTYRTLDISRRAELPGALTARP